MGATPPQTGEGSFRSKPQQGWGQISGRNWGDSLPCPTPPQGSDDPPHTGSHLPQKSQIVANPQTLLVGGGGGRSGGWEGGRPHGNVG